jgi:hypothetical protein
MVGAIPIGIRSPPAARRRFDRGPLVRLGRATYGRQAKGRGVDERRGVRALAVAGVLVVAALLAAGCGGDDDDGAAPQSG